MHDIRHSQTCIVWFFHQKHEPVGDEEDGDDENNMEMKEITPASNQDQEVIKKLL